VRVGIDAHHAAELKGALVPPPIKVEPPGVGVDFDGHPVLCTGGKNTLDINLISGATEKLPSRHVSQNGRIRILDCARNARRLRFTIKREPAVHARDYKIELIQHLLWIVQRTIGENVGFNSFENVKARSVLLIETVNRSVLLTDLLKRQPAGVVLNIQTPGASGFGHCFESINAIGANRVGVQDAANILVCNEYRKLAFKGLLYFASTLAKLWRDERKS
jgi:hypothetical protein